MKKLGLCLLLIVFLVSCDTIGIFEKNSFFKEHSWSSAVKPSFTFTITDTISLYQIYAIIRHEDSYRYNNCWLNIITIAPNDTAKSQQVNLLLADNKKGWLGTGMDDIFDHRIRLTRSPQKLKAGNYTFTLQQIMREDPLSGVLNVGIRIEKVQP
ncbi:MAG: gliding motility lipoprotein GldH [Sphingobacteriia bacterium]